MKLLVNVLDPLGIEKKDIVNSDGSLNKSDGTSIDNFSNNLLDFSSGGVGSVFDWGTKAIVVLFVLGVILMIMSFIFKNGQWQKWGQGTMLWSFIAVLVMRAIPMIILSFRSGVEVDEAFSALVNALVQVALFLGVVGVLLSFLFKFAHKLIEHPEYHRWSKNVLNVSLIMMFFAAISPFIFSIL